MTSVLMMPSTSLHPYYSPSASSSFLPSSPSSTWSPSTSPLAQMLSLPPAPSTAPACPPLSARALSCTPCHPRTATSLACQATTATAAYSLACNPALSAAAPLPTAPNDHLPAQQTIFVNHMGQAFLLSPVTSPASQQVQPQQQLQQPQRLWVSGGSEVAQWMPSGQLMQVCGPQPQLQRQPQPIFLSQTTTAGPRLTAVSASSATHSTYSAALQSPVSVLSTPPVVALTPPAVVAGSAFRTPSKRPNSAVVAAAAAPQLSSEATDTTLPALCQRPQPQPQPLTPRRRPSTLSLASSASSASSSACSSSPLIQSHFSLSMKQADAVHALSSSNLVHSPPPAPSHRVASSRDDDSSPPVKRIDGMSSSRLLTHISKKPSFVLPFTVLRSQLPGHFEGSPGASSAPESLATPSTTSSSIVASDRSDTVTINIRVMGGPDVADLYFVAADLSQLIHSRKSNIAKAVSVFSDSERARCSVVCPRSNQTQSTHILTVLTMDGVRRLLQSSRAAIALPFLVWIHAQVADILSQGKVGERREEKTSTARERTIGDSSEEGERRKKMRKE